MNYERPEIVEVGTALASVQGTVNKQFYWLLDCLHLMTAGAAYEADE